MGKSPYYKEKRRKFNFLWRFSRYRMIFCAPIAHAYKSAPHLRHKEDLKNNKAL